jgi:Glycosyltransferase family 9 (heptosyltransferase)
MKKDKSSESLPWLTRQAMVSITQPLSRPVANNEQEYLLETGVRKLGWRHFRKAIQFCLSRQNKYLSQTIPQDCKKVLWIYEGIPQLGDALMDLAPRSLLHQQGIACDLLIDAHLAPVFQSDAWFKRIATEPKQLMDCTYDLIILQSHKRRSMLKKMRHYASHPWLSMHGFYTGPEFHRARFATQRLADALGLHLADSDFEQHAQQKLCALVPAKPITASKLKIALVLGGVDPLRIYKKWPELGLNLYKQHQAQITLLGSSNASQDASAFLESWDADQAVNNLVGKTSVSDCRKIITQQDIVIACDGGLMHLSITTPVSLIALFNKIVSPQWRLPSHLQSTSLQSTTENVSDIAVETIMSAVQRTIAHHA